MSFLPPGVWHVLSVVLGGLGGQVTTQASIGRDSRVQSQIFWRNKNQVTHWIPPWSRAVYWQGCESAEIKKWTYLHFLSSVWQEQSPRVVSTDSSSTQNTNKETTTIFDEKCGKIGPLQQKSTLLRQKCSKITNCVNFSNVTTATSQALKQDT